MGTSLCIGSGHLRLSNVLSPAAITVYCVVQIDYFRRVYMNRPVRDRTNDSHVELSGGDKDTSVVTLRRTGRERITRDIKWMLAGLAAATVWIYIRSIYRTIEVSAPYL